MVNILLWQRKSNAMVTTIQEPTRRGSEEVSKQLGPVQQVPVWVPVFLRILSSVRAFLSLLNSLHQFPSKGSRDSETQIHENVQFELQCAGSRIFGNLGRKNKTGSDFFLRFSFFFPESERNKMSSLISLRGRFSRRKCDQLNEPSRFRRWKALQMPLNYLALVEFPIRLRNDVALLDPPTATMRFYRADRAHPTHVRLKHINDNNRERLKPVRQAWAYTIRNDDDDDGSCGGVLETQRWTRDGQKEMVA